MMCQDLLTGHILYIPLLCNLQDSWNSGLLLLSRTSEVFLMCLNSGLYLWAAVTNVCSLRLAEKRPFSIFFAAFTTAILSERQMIGLEDSHMYSALSSSPID